MKLVISFEVIMDAEQQEPKHTPTWNNRHLQCQLQMGCNQAIMRPLILVEERKDFLNDKQSDQMRIKRDTLLSYFSNLASNPTASTYNGTAESHVSWVGSTTCFILPFECRVTTRQLIQRLSVQRFTHSSAVVPLTFWCTGWRATPTISWILILWIHLLIGFQPLC